MRFTTMNISSIAILLLAVAPNLQAENEEGEHVWMLKKPGTVYWQTPEQQAADTSPEDSQPAGESATGTDPTDTDTIQKTETLDRNANIPPLESTAEIKHAPPVPPPPKGPFTSSSMVPDNAASAYYLPGYHPPEHNQFLRQRNNYRRYNSPQYQRGQRDFNRYEPYRMPRRYDHIDSQRAHRMTDRTDDRRRTEDARRPPQFDDRDNRWERNRDSWRNDPPVRYRDY
jgi:hypothetical protein